jgi:hypothetical protein
MLRASKKAMTPLKPSRAWARRDAQHAVGCQTRAQGLAHLGRDAPGLGAVTAIQQGKRHTHLAVRSRQRIAAVL